MLKTSESPNKLAPGRNNSSRSASSRNHNSRPASRRNNSNGEVNWFDASGDSIKYVKKSEKSKNKKLAKF